ncbi:MAG: hypothetical protein V4687_06840 [Bacteroidota bacterium]
MEKPTNLFKLWRANGGTLPFTVIKDTWSDRHHLIVHKIEILKWPYGNSYGQYFFKGDAGEESELIRSSGTGSWFLIER